MGFLDSGPAAPAPARRVNYVHFIGIDVSKERFDVAPHGAGVKPQRFANSGEGFASYAARFAAELPVALVVLESRACPRPALAGPGGRA